MSIRLLDYTAVNGKHRFQDDMESLLYVVLYCALRWQPHNLSEDALTMTISNVFDYAFKHPLGSMHGGNGKRENAAQRQYTTGVVFESAALQEWLLTVLNYHSPLPMYGDEYKDKWSTPEPLETFWATFLQTHTLESDNRFVHTLDTSKYYDSFSVSSTSSTSSTSSSSSSTTSSSSPGTLGKRSAHDGSQVRPPSKRPHSPAGRVPVPGPSRARRARAVAASTGIRRSERIAKQESKPKKTEATTGRTRPLSRSTRRKPTRT